MQQISLGGFFEWETTVYFCSLFVQFKTLLTTLTNSAMWRPIFWPLLMLVWVDRQKGYFHDQFDFAFFWWNYSMILHYVTVHYSKAWHDSWLCKLVQNFMSWSDFIWILERGRNLMWRQYLFCVSLKCISQIILCVFLWLIALFFSLS